MTAAPNIPRHPQEPVEPTADNLEALRAELHHLINPVVGSLRAYAQHRASVAPYMLAARAARLMEATDRMDAFLGERPHREQMAELRGATGANADAVKHEADHVTAPLLACMALHERKEPEYRCTVVAAGVPVAVRTDDGHWTLLDGSNSQDSTWSDVVTHLHGASVYVVPDPTQVTGREVT